MAFTFEAVMSPLHEVAFLEAAQQQQDGAYRATRPPRPPANNVNRSRNRVKPTGQKKPASTGS